MVPGKSGSPLKICFFNRSYAPDLGATGQLLAELAEDLVRHYNCQISIVAGLPTSSAKGVWKSAWRGLGFRREVIRGVTIFWALGTTFQPIRFAARTTNYMTYFLSACLASLCIPKQDVVVALTDPPIIGLAALLAARRSGARFVFLCEDVFPEVTAVLEDFQSKTVHRFLRSVSRFLIRRADAVVALGETMQDRLITEKGALREKVTVIHNWVDCRAIVPAPKKNPFSVSQGLCEAFVVTHSGNVGLSQNLDVLLDAAEKLRSYPEIVFAITGDGVRRQPLEARARARQLSNVRFFPYQPKGSLVDSFATADVFVISLKNGLSGYIVPSKLYGILAAGRPFIAAVEEDCEAAIIARQHDCGLCAQVGNPNDLVDRILTLYRNRTLARRLGENARRLALQFDRTRAVEAYFRLFCGFKR